MKVFSTESDRLPHCPTCGEKIYGYEEDTELINVSSALPRPDPNWEYTDLHGHRHDASRKTLMWIITEPAWGDYPEEGRYECKVCREIIEPGMLGPSPFQEYIPGMKTVYYLPCHHQAPNNLPPIRWSSGGQ